MQYIYLLSLSLLIGCNTEQSSRQLQMNVSSFIKNVRSLEKSEAKRPIVAFQDSAKISATKIMSLTADNIQEIIAGMKQYDYTVITTEEHTLVRIVQQDSCAQSGSWNACMPLAEGYIWKNGQLNYEKDFVNNIIGIPDSQKRVVYYFTKKQETIAE